MRHARALSAAMLVSSLVGCLARSSLDLGSAGGAAPSGPLGPPGPSTSSISSTSSSPAGPLSAVVHRASVIPSSELGAFCGGAPTCAAIDEGYFLEIGARCDDAPSPSTGRERWIVGIPPYVVRAARGTVLPLDGAKLSWAHWASDGSVKAQKAVSGSLRLDRATPLELAITLGGTGTAADGALVADWCEPSQPVGTTAIAAGKVPPVLLGGPLGSVVGSADPEALVVVTSPLASDCGDPFSFLCGGAWQWELVLPAAYRKAGTYSLSDPALTSLLWEHSVDCVSTATPFTSGALVIDALGSGHLTAHVEGAGSHAYDLAFGIDTDFCL